LSNAGSASALSAGAAVTRPSARSGSPASSSVSAPSARAWAASRRIVSASAYAVSRSPPLSSDRLPADLGKFVHGSIIPLMQKMRDRLRRDRPAHGRDQFLALRL